MPAVREIVRRIAIELGPLVVVMTIGALWALPPLGRIAVEVAGFILYFGIHPAGTFTGWFRSLAGLIFGAFYPLFAAAHLARPDMIRIADPLSGLPREYYLLVGALSVYVLSWLVVRRGEGPQRGLFVRAFRWLMLAMVFDCLLLIGLVGVAAGGEWLGRHEMPIRLVANLLFLGSRWVRR